MDTVLKHFSRVNKKAVKFRFTVSYHELQVGLLAPSRWKPNKLSVAWARRNRRFVTEPRNWEGSTKDPFSCSIVWIVPENKEALITLFRDPKSHEFEEKIWTFYLEDVSSSKQQQHLAKAHLNMSLYASLVPTQQNVNLNMVVTSKKIVKASLSFTISCVFISEGKASDEDLRSLASFVTNNRTCDVAKLEDFEEEDTEINNEFPNSSSSILRDIKETEYGHTPISIETETFTNLQSEPEPDVEALAMAAVKTPIEAELQIPSTTAKPSLENLNYQSLEKLSSELNAVTTTNQLNPFLTDEEPQNGNTATDDKLQETEELLPISACKRDTLSVGLLEWCQKTKQEYEGVRSANFTTSWRDGMGSKPNEVPLTNQLNPSLIEFESRNGYPTEDKLQETGELFKIISTSACKNETISVGQLEGCQKTKQEYDVVRSASLTTSWRDGMGSESNEVTLTNQLNPSLIGFEPANGYATEDKLQETEKLSSCSAGEDEEDTLYTDLLEWCQKITQGYHGVCIANLTTSWIDGMAFCAIIHHFRPELIHYESLNQLDAHANCKLAFEIGECLGILKVLTPEDLIQHAVPDKLAVIAYILQLQAYFTRQDRPIEELCLVKQVTIDTKPEITISTVNNLSQTEPKQEQLPKSKNNICGLRGYTNQTPEVTDTQSSPVSNTDHTSAEPSCYIADQLEYSARDYSDNENSDSEICSLSPSPVESNQEHLLKPADEPLENSTDEGQGFGEHSEAIKTKSSSVSSICSNCTEGGNDFTNELEELEREQWYIDQQAAVLKKELCWLSEGGSSSPFRKEMEQYFLKQWLMLINKKNNVIRRKAQLNLLRKKMNLEQRFVLLEQEIRQLLALDDGQKTEVEKVREKILLEELVINVNQRDELVRLFDIQEKALEDDEIIQCEVLMRLSK